MHVGTDFLKLPPVTGYIGLSSNVLCSAPVVHVRADACRFAHPQPPVPQGVPRDLLLILQAIARAGSLSLRRS